MLQYLVFINERTSLFLSQFSHIHWIQATIPFFADGPIFIIPLFLVGFWIYLTIQKNTAGKNNLLLIFYMCLLGIIIDLIIQYFFFVERPITFLQNKGTFILSHIPNTSFPSDHTTIGMAFLVGLFFLGYRKYVIYLLPLFIGMFLARIVGGIHWVSDIIGGIVVGILSGYIILILKDTKLLQAINKKLISLLEK